MVIKYDACAHIYKTIDKSKELTTPMLIATCQLAAIHHHNAPLQRLEHTAKENGQQSKMGKPKQNAICHCEVADMKEGEEALTFVVENLGR